MSQSHVLPVRGNAPGLRYSAFRHEWRGGVSDASFVVQVHGDGWMSHPRWSRLLVVTLF